LSSTLPLVLRNSLAFSAAASVTITSKLPQPLTIPHLFSSPISFLKQQHDFADECSTIRFFFT
ncbi:MAG: hypothetical protein ACLPY5_13985, partial [Candidatus Bathyarchaeia archaeon]